MTDFKDMMNKVILGDCLKVMEKIPDKKINMILTDLPYGKTRRNRWDMIISLDKLWKEYKRVIINRGVIVLTAAEPFTSILVMNDIEMFKYDLVWEKRTPVGHYNVKKMPLRNHETILIFYKELPVYNPQKIEERGVFHKDKIIYSYTDSKDYGKSKRSYFISNLDGKYYPRSIIGKFSRDREKLHPTQKPLLLFEYLIKTYTNEGDLILDSCAGSFTTAVAAINLKRNWICIDKEKGYCEIGLKRIGQRND